VQAVQQGLLPVQRVLVHGVSLSSQMYSNIFFHTRNEENESASFMHALYRKSD
jgi:hypothetical protein